MAFQLDRGALQRLPDAGSEPVRRAEPTDRASVCSFDSAPPVMRFWSVLFWLPILSRLVAKDLVLEHPSMCPGSELLRDDDDGDDHH